MNKFGNSKKYTYICNLKINQHLKKTTMATEKNQDLEPTTDGSLDSQHEGVFYGSLKRNNKQIRDDRAQAIAEDTQLVFKRRIEDLELNIKKMKREQENMLDLSPTNAQSLILASDFDATSYTNKDIELSVRIRNEEITRDLARARYTYLFGGIK